MNPDGQTLVPQLIGGFTPAAADSFTVLTSNVVLTGTPQNLNAGRIGTANGRGSFAFTLTNGGTAVELSNYQPVAPEQAWRNTYFMPAQQTDPLISGDMADPDGDGMNNLLEFALNSNPFRSTAPDHLPAGGNGATPQTSSAPGNGSPPGIIDEVDPTEPVIPGSTARRCRVPVIAGGEQFLRIKAVKP